MKYISSLFLFLFLSLGVSAKSFKVNITSDGASNLSVFLPEAQQATGRMVIILPGGGYSQLMMDYEGTDWAPFFNARGIAVGVLKYRMPNGNRRIPMHDAYAAMQMAHDSAQAWKVNPNDIGIMGSSAGGHLASVVSTMAPMAIRPAFSILFYPVISMTYKETHHGSVNNFLGADKNNQAVIDSFSTNKAVRKHAVPPTIIFLANDDNVVPILPNGVAYYSAMHHVGNDVTMYAYPRGGHGFGYHDSFPYHVQMLQELDAWLRYLPTPQPNAVKVACIGNSITDGSGIFMRDLFGYPAQLQKMLGNGYVVKNFGVGGRTALNHGNLPYQKEAAWRDALSFCPDIAVIKLGTNDSKPMNWKYKDEFMPDMQQLIDSLRALPSHPRIILCTPLPGPNRPNSIRDSVLTKEICPMIKRLAKKNKLELIDFHSTYQCTEGMMQRDSIHPTIKGAGQMAEAVKNMILNPKKNSRR